MLKGRGIGKVSSDYEKAYEETGAAYLLISFSYEQTAAAYEEIERIDFLPLKSKKPLPFQREGLFASDLL